MKNLKFVLGALLSVALFTACSDDKDGEASYLKVETTSINKDATAQDFTIPVSTDVDALNVETSYEEGEEEGWCTAKFADKTLSIHLDVNNVMVERTAKVKLSVLGVDPVIVTIVQDAAAAARDPFEPDSYLFPWDNSWGVENFTYYNKAGGGYTDPSGDYISMKYEPKSWGELGVPPVTDWDVDNNRPIHQIRKNDMGDNITIGLKLGSELLAKFGGKKLLRIMLETDEWFIAQTEVALVKAKVDDNLDGVPSYVTETYSATNTIGSKIVASSGQSGKYVDVDLTDQNITIPTEGNIFVVAYIEGANNGPYHNGGIEFGKLNYYPQPINRFAPNYVSFSNNEGQKMYKFLGGVISLAFVVDK